MKINKTFIEDLLIFKPQLFKDDRGFFYESYNKNNLDINIVFVQDNESKSYKGVIRGLHFQAPPFEQTKLVRCVSGNILDVAVDLRYGSPTFLQWHAEMLCSQSNRMLIIPEGFAHGFQALEANSELLYLHTNFYTPNAESGLRHDDPTLGIKWPEPFADLSIRDKNHSLLDAEFIGIKT